MELIVPEELPPPPRLNRPPAIIAAPISWARQVYHGLVIAGLAVVSYLVISHYFLQTVEVQGVSMMPTLHNTDHYFLNRWTYHLHPPQRGDIVVLKDPTDGAIAVKRIIALPGETVHFKDGKVLVNDRPLDESYLAPRTATFTGMKAHEEIITCGQDRFFVMGDNRLQSFDSRMYGPVPRGNLLGLIIR